jgi:hypothetical protein
MHRVPLTLFSIPSPSLINQPFSPLPFTPLVESSGPHTRNEVYRMLGPIPILLMDIRRRTSGTNTLSPPACLPASLPACLPACLCARLLFTHVVVYLSISHTSIFFSADHLVYSNISLLTMCLCSKWKERQIVTSFSF